MEFNYQDSSDDHDKDGNANQTQGFHAFERQIILFSVAYKCSLNFKKKLRFYLKCFLTTSLLFLQLWSVYMQVGSRATNLEMAAVVGEMEVRDRVCNDH